MKEELQPYLDRKSLRAFLLESVSSFSNPVFCFSVFFFFTFPVDSKSKLKNVPQLVIYRTQKIYWGVFLIRVT